MKRPIVSMRRSGRGSRPWRRPRRRPLRPERPVPGRRRAHPAARAWPAHTSCSGATSRVPPLAGLIPDAQAPAAATPRPVKAWAGESPVPRSSWRPFAQATMASSLAAAPAWPTGRAGAPLAP